MRLSGPRTRREPLDDGADKNLYHSPISGQMPPLHMIVLAYHAAANIMLFCRNCPSRSRTRPRRMEAEFLDAASAYEGILR